MAPLVDVLTPWHDVFMLFGTASATLIGLLFVAASVGSRVYSKDHHPALRSFLSPTVVHFTCVLVAALIAISPLRTRMVLGFLVGAVGLFGVGYAVFVLRRMVQLGLTATIDLEDQIYYAAMPAVAYLIMTSAGVTFLLQAEWGCEVLAAAMGLLLLVGIRNAWDITVWAVIRSPG